MTDPGLGSRRRRCRSRRRAGRLPGVLVLLALWFTTLGTVGNVGTAVARTAHAPGPGNPTVGRTSSTAAPFGDYVTRLKFDVSTITPVLVTTGGPALLTITGTMVNTGPEELVDLSYRFQRGAAVSSTADVHDQIAQPTEPLARVPSRFTPVTAALATGASAPFSFTTSLTAPDALDITEPGVYPLMVNINGGVVLPAGPLEARIGELHLLLTVMGVPTVAGAQTSVRPTPGGRPAPFNFVWPVVDTPHLGVDGVFLDDDLRTAISPGGRLAILLDGLTSQTTRSLPAGSLTLVIDPQLIDELDRMTGPYRVVATPGDPQPPVTAIAQAQGPGTTQAATGGASQTGAATSSPPATGQEPAATATASGTATGTPAADQPGELSGTVAGTGQQAAASFLERLRAVAADHPALLLPYGDPDMVALVRAGLTAEIASAQEHGVEVARRVLGDLPTMTATTAYPIDGAADDATLAALISAGARTGLLSQISVDVPAGAGGRPAAAARIDVERPASTGTALPSVIAQTDVLGGLDKLIDDRQQTGWAMKVNSLTALLAQQRIDGTGTPAVLAPDRRWSPDSAGLDGLVRLLGELGHSGVIAGQSLAALSNGAEQTGTTDYPAQARDRELTPLYLQRISDDRAAVAQLRSALGSVPQRTDPALVLDPLDRALDAGASTAFRTDPTVGDANLATVESAVAGIRSGVQIASAGNSYTLASSSSPLVLTVQNSLPYDVPLAVQITGGEMVGLTVTDQPVQIIPAGRSQQVKIPTEVTRSGQFQVTATLIGPDGTAWGSPVQLSVESSAYGALTVILMAVAGGVLVVMVALRIRQRLRGRRARIAAAASTAGTAAADDTGADDIPHDTAAGARRDTAHQPSDAGSVAGTGGRTPSRTIGTGQIGPGQIGTGQIGAPASDIRRPPGVRPAGKAAHPTRRPADERRLVPQPPRRAGGLPEDRQGFRS